MTPRKTEDRGPSWLPSRATDVSFFARFFSLSLSFSFSLSLSLLSLLLDDRLPLSLPLVSAEGRFEDALAAEAFLATEGFFAAAAAAVLLAGLAAAVDAASLDGRRAA